MTLVNNNKDPNECVSEGSFGEDGEEAYVKMDAHVKTTQHDRHVGLTRTHARLNATDATPWTSIGTMNGSWGTKLNRIDTVLKQDRYTFRMRCVEERYMLFRQVANILLH